MSFFSFRAFVFSCLITLAVSKYVEKELHPQETMVGEFEGKRYWMDTNTRFQPDAANFCRNLGFTPVQFDSLAEIEFLSTRLEPAKYWTAGVDIGTIEQYAWVQGESSNVIAVDVENLVPYTGIYLDRSDNTLKAEDIHTSMRPLCQQISL